MSFITAAIIGGGIGLLGTVGAAAIGANSQKNAANTANANAS